MQFTTELVDFQKCLQRVLPAVPDKQPAFELLEHFSLELKGDTLTIVASDIEIYIKTTMQVTGEEDGAILVPAKRFMEFLRGLDPSKELLIRTSEDNDLKLEILSGKTSLKINGLDEYIELPDIFNENPPDKEAKDTIFFEQSLINKLSEKTTFAISTKDNYRVNMSGVLFQFRENYVNAVATDSVRLIRYTQFAGDRIYPEALNITIPLKAMEILRKIDSDATFSYDKTKENPIILRVDYGNTIIVTKLIKETFPPYENIIPTTSICNATFDISAFLEALKRIAPILTSSSKSTPRKCKLDFSTDTLTIIAENTDSGELGVTEIACELEEAETFSISFNITFLQELISNITANETNNNLIGIYFSSSDKAALIKPKSDEDQIIEMLMPMRNA